MENFTSWKVFVLSLAGVTLAACGGGGGSNGGDPMVDAPTFGDADSVASSARVATILDANAQTVTSSTGQLNRSANTGTIGDLSGTLSADRSSIALSDGGAVTFADPGDGFATRFAADTDTPTIGIAGIATATGDLPGGSASYIGDTVITATNGTDLYELTGVSEITATFAGDTPSVTTVLSDLAGTRQPALAAAQSVADAGTLTLTGSEIDGATFSGGTAALDSDVLSLSGDETVSVAGAFFGPEADQAGGVFAITGGETQVFGDFLAE